MAANMHILKCTAEYGKVYYIEFGGVRQCRLVATESDGTTEYYVLDIAGLGIRHVCPKSKGLSTNWWHTSQIDSVLAETPEDLSRRRFLKDWYGSTANAYNSRFIEPFFPNYSVCGCGGGIHFWTWNGTRPELQSVSSPCAWRINQEGFHCVLNENTEGRFRSEKECRAHNQINVITF